MKLVVLAAGYATRLYPLTLDRPKMLLDVAGVPMLDRLLEKLAPIRSIDETYLVTNSKFAGQFREWAATYAGPLAPRVVDDGTGSEDDRLGATGDLDLVLRREGIDDDVIVAAGDNLFTETLEGFGEFARARRAPVLAVYDVGDRELLRRYSSVDVGDDGRIVRLEEKPEHPRGTLSGIALYFYPRDTLPLVRRYLDEGGNPDQPGRFVQWLVARHPVYAWEIPGRWIDIGSHETLHEAGELFHRLDTRTASRRG
ncbi:MAG: nucleotidyltransferase family protein [Actinomycetota bacterium]|nr:nucleotidyltransferase family protein [Actinomycetota bacterium]